MVVKFDVTFDDGTRSEPQTALDADDARLKAEALKAQWQADRADGRADDFLGPAVEGVTGGWADEASGAIGALIGAIRGEGVAAGYRRGFEGSKQRRERFARVNPKTSEALEIGGNVAGFALTPEIKAAQALGVGGRLATRGVNALATGGAYGAAAGAGYAESPEGLDSSPAEIAGSTLGGAAEGAGIGAAAGLGGEALVSGVGGAVRGVRRAAGRMLPSGTRGATEADIGRTIQRENPGETVDQLVERMRGLQEEGYPAVVGDMGRTRTRRMARAAADASPEAQETLEGVTGPRYRAQGGRTEAAIERISGGVGEETRFGLQDRVDQAMRERGHLYDQAYEVGDRGIAPSPAMADLAAREPLFVRALREARTNLEARNNAARAHGEREWDMVGSEAVGRPGEGIPDRAGSGSGPRLTLAYWDQVKRALDRMERTMRDRQGGSRAEAARTIDMIRRALVGHLTREVPEYQRALGTYSTLFGGRDAGEAGVEAFNRQMTGVELERVMADMTPGERDMFRTSWISKFAETVSGISNGADIAKRIGQSDKALRQLRAMLGPEGTQRLLRHRDIERGLQQLHEEVTGNSKTARYLVGLTGAGVGAVGAGFNPLNPSTWTQAALAGGAGFLMGHGAARLRMRVGERQARWIADALSSGDPEMLRRVYVAAQRVPAVRDTLSTIGRAIGGAAASGATQ